MNTSIALSSAVTLLIDPFAGHFSNQPIVFDEAPVLSPGCEYDNNETLSIVQNFSGSLTFETEEVLWQLDEEEQEIMHSALLNSSRIIDDGQLLF